MKPRTQLLVLGSVALSFLLIIGGLATWLGQQVLNPIRTVDTTASGSSILATPRSFFKTPALGGRLGTPLSVPISIDTNGGSLNNITAELRYNPLDMSVDLGVTTTSVCSAYTKREHDEIAGIFTVSCTAPTTVGSQVSPFLTFIVTPRRIGGLPLELVGRTNDYAVVTVQ